LAGFDAFDCYELAHRGQDEEGPAGLALAIDVDAVVSLLFPHVLKRFVLAGGHAYMPCADGILAFGNENPTRGPAA